MAGVTCDEKYFGSYAVSTVFVVVLKFLYLKPQKIKDEDIMADWHTTVRCTRFAGAGPSHMWSEHALAVVKQT